MLTKLYSWYGKKMVWGIFAGIVLLIVAGVTIASYGGDSAIEEQQKTKIVRVGQAGTLSLANSAVSVIGTVTAIDEAEIKSEVSGQITSVPVSIGDRVSAGAVLATFENSRERASVLQAEGAYEAAVASAAQSNISAGASKDDLTNASEDAWNDYRTAFVSADSIMHNTLDALFGDYNRQILDLDKFNWERRLIRYELDDWGTASRELVPSDPSTSLEAAEKSTRRLTQFVDSVYTHITSLERGTSDTTTLEIISTYKASLSTARTTLNTSSNTLATARATLLSTKAAYEKAQLGGTSGELSSANASVKQALGSLRLAQSALEKTTVRSPITGVVNTVHVKTGSYVSMANPVAMVVNNGALEITTYLSEEDRARIAIGDSVALEDGDMSVVTKIAPSIDRTTQKYEVKLSPQGSTALNNGDVVRLALDTSSTQIVSDVLYIPLTSVKLTADSAVVFTVADDGILKAHPVVLGSVRGVTVGIEEGVTADTTIVIDARGLNDGEVVRIAQ